MKGMGMFWIWIGSEWEEVEAEMEWVVVLVLLCLAWFVSRLQLDGWIKREPVMNQNQINGT